MPCLSCFHHRLGPPVTPHVHAYCMDDGPPLQRGSHILCPHCRAWHPVVIGHLEGIPYTQAMMYWVCRGGRYYAGQRSQMSRHPTRLPVRGAMRVVSGA